MTTLVQPTYLGRTTHAAEGVYSTVAAVPSTTDADFWILVAGGNNWIADVPGWTTVRKNGQYGYVYIAYTRTDPGSSITLKMSQSSGSMNFSVTIVAYKNVAEIPFVYEALTSSTTLQTTHNTTAWSPAGYDGFASFIGCFQSGYGRTVSSYGFINLTIYGNNYKWQSPNAAPFTTHIAERAAVDPNRSPYFSTRYSSTSRAYGWMGVLQYGEYSTGPSFTRDGVAGADIGTVDGLQASDIAGVDGVSAVSDGGILLSNDPRYMRKAA